MSHTRSIQEKMKELESLVAWFDTDEFVIEESLATYKKAEKLAKEIEDDLAQLKNEVVVLKQKFDQDA